MAKTEVFGIFFGKMCLRCVFEFIAFLLLLFDSNRVRIRVCESKKIHFFYFFACNLCLSMLQGAHDWGRICLDDIKHKQNKGVLQGLIF